MLVCTKVIANVTQTKYHPDRQKGKASREKSLAWKHISVLNEIVSFNIWSINTLFLFFS